MKKLLVKTPVNYPIYISDNADILKEISGEVFKNAKNVAIITDNNVFELYGRYFDGLIKGKKLFYLALSAGENEKSTKNYLKIIDFLNENGFTRNDMMIAFGGGVVGDTAGFAAATYMRGIRYINVPTTILAMVDSSVGGKTGVDFNGVKNLVGAFYQPTSVIINVRFFETLPKREVLSGFGEIIKYAFFSEKIIESLKKGKFNEALVYECLKVKRDIVERDAFEAGERKLLNLGHTFGHAIEELSEFALSHGECVVKGLYLTLKASVKLNEIDQNNCKKAMDILNSAGHDLSVDVPFEDIKNILYYDKKYNGESLSFVALDKDLKPYITVISVEKLVGLIK